MALSHTPVKAGLQEIDIEVGIRMRLGPGKTEASFNPTQTEQIEVEVDR
jgi:hypothetical protein